MLASADTSPIQTYEQLVSCISDEEMSPIIAEAYKKELSPTIGYTGLLALFAALQALDMILWLIYICSELHILREEDRAH